MLFRSSHGRSGGRERRLDDRPRGAIAGAERCGVGGAVEGLYIWGKRPRGGSLEGDTAGPAATARRCRRGSRAAGTDRHGRPGSRPGPGPAGVAV